MSIRNLGSRSALAISVQVLLCITAAATVAFVVLPLAAVMPISFSSGSYLNYPLPGFSLRWYDKVLAPYPWMFAFRNSLLIALATTAAATVLGTLAAYGFTVGNFRHKAALTAFITSPLIIPTVVTALSVYFFMARIGLLGSFTALVLAHTVIAVPFVFITVAASLQGFDRTVTRAAVSLGATPLRAFWTTTFPMNLPGIASGAIFAFITSFDDVVIALFLASPSRQTLPRQLFGGLREDLEPTVIAVATLLVGISLAFYVVVEFLRRRALSIGRQSINRDQPAALPAGLDRTTGVDN